MNHDASQPTADPGRPTERIAVAATFTAEPVEPALGFWMDELGRSWSIAFAPYNQVFQQLLDPASLLSRNQQGINVLLVRLEDWQRCGAGSSSREVRAEHLSRNAAELVEAVRVAAARSSARLILAFCPASPPARADLPTRALFEQIEGRIAAELQGVPGLCLIRTGDFQVYPVDLAYDPERDRLAHIPYTPLFYAALGTILARRIHALTSRPYKVIVLDCDNTLWRGVLGEDGVEGIAIPPAWARGQDILVRLASQGFLLGLCSKNNEADVLAVFDHRPEMILKRDHLVCWRINWQPKSENLRAMARELNLGLDSVIFLDDNPIECAEVRAGCPEVLTLRLPIEGDLVRFLEHVWAFDRPTVTAEDRHRTAMYQQEVQRARLQQEAPSLEAFLAGLDLRIAIDEPGPDQIDRVAQLTQRTNQFNFTTIRRDAGEIRRLADSGRECRVVTVRDRFGDYGLVGVLIFAAGRDALEVDTFLLSCRVLGRGVEHRMLGELGAIARQRGLSWVEAPVIPTAKNQPARDFLARVAAADRADRDGMWLYRIPAAAAATVTHRPEAAAVAEEDPPLPTARPTAAVETMRPGPWQRFERIAAELYLPEQVLETIQSRPRRRRGLTAEGRPPIAPRTELEAAMAELWASVLRVEPVGIRDDFFDLGGTSLLSVDLCAQIERRFGRKLPLTAILEAPTVERLARRVAEDPSAGRDSLVPIRSGGDGPPLFLVHDGDGETMLYRNLALRLKPDQAVYGLQPLSRGEAPIAHTRIPEMAAHHVDRIRSVQPKGPYLVGGMCAGGVLAFEVARQLQAEGEAVAMVALLDAADVAAPAKAWRVARGRAQSFAAVFRPDPSARPGRRALAILARAARKARNLAVYETGKHLAALRDGVRFRLLRHYLDRGMRLPRLLERLPVRTVYQLAERDYHPSGRFDGELVLFRATAGSGAVNDEPFIERYEDPLLGWGRRATRGVRVLDVPGGHSSMLQEPNVRVLAQQMQAYLDAALFSGSFNHEKHERHEMKQGSWTGGKPDPVGSQAGADS